MIGRVTNRKGGAGATATTASAASTNTSNSPPSSLSIRRNVSQRKGILALSSSTSNKQSACSVTTLCFVGTIVSILLTWFWFLSYLIDTKSVRFFHGRQWLLRHDRQQQRATLQRLQNNPYCAFRRYGDHRLYNVARQSNDVKALKDGNKNEGAMDEIPPQPDFLLEAEYIHGEWPVILQEHEHPTKLCVNQSEWWSYKQRGKNKRAKHVDSATTTAAVATPTMGSATTIFSLRLPPYSWPFADGTNPSIVHVSRLQQQAPQVAHQILHFFPTAAYVVTVCMTNSQCTWKDEKVQATAAAAASTTTTSKANAKSESTTTTLIDLPNLKQTQPDTVRTILQLLSADFTSLVETTIVMELNAPWGKRFRDTPPSSSDQVVQQHIPGLDDARLFVYNDNLYVSYREGPSFGYDAQVVNPIHLDFASSNVMIATLKASETFSFCCGRNMALIPDWNDATSSHVHDAANVNTEQQPLLYALTWVDPVTIEKVDTTPLIQSTKKPKAAGGPTKHQRRLQQDTISATSAHEAELHDSPQRQRRLQEAKKHKSHIHGTNAFMVPLPHQDSNGDDEAPVEFLGVAHFHRPNDRKPNDFARFGHHYTHAFYTVAATASSAEHDNDDPTKARLTGLSSEFVLPAVYQPDNAEIIQFVSGLEYNAETDQVVLAYGINDCEAAVTTLDLSIVRSMLLPVTDEDKQVVDYMSQLKDVSSSI